MQPTAECTGGASGPRRLRFIGCAAVLLLVFALGTNALIILQGALQPVHVVSGDSMAPGIRPEDGLVLAPAEPEELAVGQVVVFPDPEEPGQHIVHRIVGTERREGTVYLVTKGDNNPEPDPVLVPPGSVEGKVVLRLPAFGLFLDFVRTPFGFSACVICPVLLFFLWCLAQKLICSPVEDKGLQRLLAVPVFRG